MKTSVKTIVLILIGIVAGIWLGYSITSALHIKHKSVSIIEVLKENCDCNEVNQVIYAKGIQFGENGISTEKAEYELIDCNFSVSIENKVKDLNKILMQKVAGYKNIDLLELEFINDDKKETIIIKNGKI